MGPIAFAMSNVTCLRDLPCISNGNSLSLFAGCH